MFPNTTYVRARDLGSRGAHWKTGSPETHYVIQTLILTYNLVMTVTSVVSYHMQ